MPLSPSQLASRRLHTSSQYHLVILSFPIGSQETITIHFLSIPSCHSLLPIWHPGDYTLPLNTILPFYPSQLASRRLHTSSQCHLTILSFPIGIQETTHFLSMPSCHFYPSQLASRRLHTSSQYRLTILSFPIGIQETTHFLSIPSYHSLLPNWHPGVYTLPLNAILSFSPSQLASRRLHTSSQYHLAILSFPIGIQETTHFLSMPSCHSLLPNWHPGDYYTLPLNTILPFSHSQLASRRLHTSSQYHIAILSFPIGIQETTHFFSIPSCYSLLPNWHPGDYYTLHTSSQYHLAILSFPIGIQETTHFLSMPSCHSLLPNWHPGDYTLPLNVILSFSPSQLASRRLHTSSQCHLAILSFPIGIQETTHFLSMPSCHSLLPNWHPGDYTLPLNTILSFSPSQLASRRLHTSSQCHLVILSFPIGIQETTHFLSIPSCHSLLPNCHPGDYTLRLNTILPFPHSQLVSRRLHTSSQCHLAILFFPIGIQETTHFISISSCHSILPNWHPGDYTLPLNAILSFSSSQLASRRQHTSSQYHLAILSFPIGIQETKHFFSIPSCHSLLPNWHPGDYTLRLNTILPFPHSQLASRRLNTSSQYHLAILSFPIGIQETTHFLSIPSCHSLLPNWHPGDYTLPLNTILPFSPSQLASRRLHTSSQYHLAILSFPIGIRETTHFLSIPSCHSLLPNWHPGDYTLPLNTILPFSPLPFPLVFLIILVSILMFSWPIYCFAFWLCVLPTPLLHVCFPFYISHTGSPPYFFILYFFVPCDVQ